MKYKRGDINWEVIAWILAILVLAFAVFMIVIIRKQGFNMIDYIKNFLRFGG